MKRTEDRNAERENSRAARVAATLAVHASVVFLSDPLLFASELPSNVVPVPVEGARCIAIHPTKPVLYVGGWQGWQTGKNLTTFRLDDEGRVVASSRHDLSDGIFAGTTPSGARSEYGVTSIAVNPARPEIYLAASPRRLAPFLTNDQASLVVSLALGDDGQPVEKVAGFRQAGRTCAVSHIECDPIGRCVHLGGIRGHLTFWALDGPSAAPLVTVLPKGKAVRPPAKSRLAILADRSNLVVPLLTMYTWVGSAEWGRNYGFVDRGRAVIFTLSEDGRSFSFVQTFPMPDHAVQPPMLSVKHHKLYIPTERTAKLGIYWLTREGHLTSLPRFVPVDPVRLAVLDDRNDFLYVIGPKSTLAIYSLDTEGMPSGEPRRLQLPVGEVNDAVVSPRGILYLACTSPSGGKA